MNHTHEHDPELQKEAESRWGQTEAWRQSQRRTKSYGPEQWATIKGAGAENEAAFAELMRSGADPDGEAAMDLAEAARRHIDRWFYDCPPAMHVGLADMYEADPRFRAHYDEREPGLAAFVSAAIRANARRRA